jgi:cardiolipin synthase
MIDSIKGAKQYIYLESYIFDDDVDAEYKFLDILIGKAKKGVKIKIVLDSFGSYSFSSEMQEKLASAGVEVCFFGYWLRRIHRKILIVDGTVAFMGGVNIGMKYRKWQDLHVRLPKKMIKSLISSFAKSYYYAGGTDPDVLKLRKKGKMKKAKLWLVEHFPWTGKFLLKTYYKDKISLAKDRVVIVTPYFVPHHWLTKLLKQAIARGVNVEIILPEITDVSFINFANRVSMLAFEDFGIKFYLTKDMIHAKALLVDEVVGLVGSNNIDAMSFDYNAEASLSFESREMIDDLKRIIEIWKADSTIFKHNDEDKTWYYMFAKAVVRFFQPVL